MNDLDRVIHRLHHLEEKLDRVLLAQEQLKELLMSVADDMKAGFAKMDVETNLIADNVKAMAAKIKNSMTDQEVADLKTMADALHARLTSLSVDPTNPVPPEPASLAAARVKLASLVKK